jgi:hypothetical protein
MFSSAWRSDKLETNWFVGHLGGDDEFGELDFEVAEGFGVGGAVGFEVFEFVGELGEEGEGEPVAGVGGGVEDFLEEDGEVGGAVLLEFGAEWIEDGGVSKAVVFEDHAGVRAGFGLFPGGEGEPFAGGGGIAGDVTAGGDLEFDSPWRIRAEIVFFKTIAIDECIQCHFRTVCDGSPRAM